MVDKFDYYTIIKQGASVWNTWRANHPDIEIDLSVHSFKGLNLSQFDFSDLYLEQANFEDVNLCGANFSSSTLDISNFSGADLSDADLTEASLAGTNLTDANFSGANLSQADLQVYSSEVGFDFDEKIVMHSTHLDNTNFSHANLTGAILCEADFTSATLKHTVFCNADLEDADFSNTHLENIDLSGASLTNANFSGASLKGANLRSAHLLGANFNNADLSMSLLEDADLREASFCNTNLDGATLTGCRVYGISAWKVSLIGAQQKNLIITPNDQLDITIDNLEVAQFIYLMLNNQKLRDIISTITSKAVLILGRFTEERKLVLDALREELRQHNLLPIVFDFKSSPKRDLTETISMLAHMSRFIIADLTDAKSIPQELQAIVPHLPSVPVQPILHVDDRGYSMFEHFKHYPWVLETYHYQDIPTMLASIEKNIIEPAEKKALDLETKK